MAFRISSVLAAAAISMAGTAGQARTVDFLLNFLPPYPPTSELASFVPQSRTEFGGAGGLIDYLIPFSPQGSGVARLAPAGIVGGIDFWVGEIVITANDPLGVVSKVEASWVDTRIAGSDVVSGEFRVYDLAYGSECIVRQSFTGGGVGLGLVQGTFGACAAEEYAGGVILQFGPTDRTTTKTELRAVAFSLTLPEDDDEVTPVAPVPLPAGLPLGLSALALLWGLGRLRGRV